MARVAVIVAVLLWMASSSSLVSSLLFLPTSPATSAHCGRTSSVFDRRSSSTTILRHNKRQFQQSISSEDDSEQQQQQQGGSVVGAALLFAGTAVGAGMLALPAETAPAGFAPAESSLLLCWAFTFVTSLVTLEASWSVGRRSRDNNVLPSADTTQEAGGAGFVSITKTALGPIGEGVTALLFWFLLSAIIVAYTSEGGELIAQGVSEYTNDSSLQVSPIFGSFAFTAFFGSLAVFGTERVDLVNRILVVGFLGAFLGLAGIGLPQIDPELLSSRADWGAVYPACISVGILSFGAQNVVPTLLQYLGGDAIRTRQAVLAGSLIPLVMYTLWEVVFLGNVPWDAADASVGSKMQVVTALGRVGGPVVQELVEVFSACAIGSSMAGASVSLVDFFQDAISTITPPPGNEVPTGITGRRFLAAALALGPPLGLACVFPDAFLSALENAGLIGGVSLYGLLPALSVIQLRDTPDGEVMPGRLGGGSTALYALIAVSAALVLPEFIRLGGAYFAT